MRPGPLLWPHQPQFPATGDRRLVRPDTSKAATRPSPERHINSTVMVLAVSSRASNTAGTGAYVRRRSPERRQTLAMAASLSIKTDTLGSTEAAGTFQSTHRTESPLRQPTTSCGRWPSVPLKALASTLWIEVVMSARMESLGASASSFTEGGPGGGSCSGDAKPEGISSCRDSKNGFSLGR